MAKHSFNTRELHVMHVFQDPDFVADIQQVLQENNNAIEEAYFLQKNEFLNKTLQPIQQKWCLTIADIRNYIGWKSTSDDVLDYLQKEAHILLNPNLYIQDDGINEQDKFSSLVFDIDRVQKRDFLEVWNKISNIQKIRNEKQSRTRVTADDKLIYAIFKQRQKTPPTTFKVLYEMYESNSLPGYNEKPRRGIYRDYTWLQKHYNRYKPQIPYATENEIQQYYFTIHNLPIDDDKFDDISNYYERKKQANQG